MLKAEIRAAPCCATLAETAGPEALEAAELRLAFGVDFAPVVGLALVFGSQDLVRRIQLGKALSGFGVALVGVRVQLLGELAIGTLDRRRIRILLHPQDFIGVAHFRYLRLGRRPAPAPVPNVVAKYRFRNANLSLRKVMPRGGASCLQGRSGRPLRSPGLQRLMRGLFASTAATA
jgi:hypothetical protein